MSDDTTLNTRTSARDRVSDVARTIDRFSSESRERRRARKLREELVREHILGGARRRRDWLSSWLARWRR